MGMGTVLAVLLFGVLVGAMYVIYTRSHAAGSADEDGRDLERFLVANRELRLERIDNDLWATAMRLAHGDDGVARARYVELRVRQMKENSKAAAEDQQTPS